MIYAMSDLHGRYDKFIQMLDYIEFSDNDLLYLLGDLCDRGPQSAELYLDIMSRKNVFCIMGNHEKMLLDSLPSSFGFLKQNIEPSESLDFEMWSACGGNQTCASLITVGIDKVLPIYNFISSLPYYRTVNLNSKNYLLVHAGLDNYSESKPLNGYATDELIWGELDYEGRYYSSQFDKIIVGHTPTFLLRKSMPPQFFTARKML